MKKRLITFSISIYDLQVLTNFRIHFMTHPINLLLGDLPVFTCIYALNQSLIKIVSHFALLLHFLVKFCLDLLQLSSIRSLKLNFNIIIAPSTGDQIVLIVFSEIEDLL